MFKQKSVTFISIYNGFALGTSSQFCRTRSRAARKFYARLQRRHPNREVIVNGIQSDGFSIHIQYLVLSSKATSKEVESSVAQTPPWLPDEPLRAVGIDPGMRATLTGALYAGDCVADAVQLTLLLKQAREQWTEVKKSLLDKDGRALNGYLYAKLSWEVGGIRRSRRLKLDALRCYINSFEDKDPTPKPQKPAGDPFKDKDPTTKPQKPAGDRWCALLARMSTNDLNSLLDELRNEKQVHRTELLDKFPQILRTLHHVARERLDAFRADVPHDVPHKQPSEVDASSALSDACIPAKIMKAPTPFKETHIFVKVSSSEWRHKRRVRWLQKQRQKLDKATWQGVAVDQTTGLPAFASFKTSVKAELEVAIRQTAPLLRHWWSKGDPDYEQRQLRSLRLSLDHAAKSSILDRMTMGDRNMMVLYGDGDWNTQGMPWLSSPTTELAKYFKRRCPHFLSVDEFRTSQRLHEWPQAVLKTPVEEVEVQDNRVYQMAERKRRLQQKVVEKQAHKMAETDRLADQCRSDESTALLAAAEVAVAKTITKLALQEDRILWNNKKGRGRRVYGLTSCFDAHVLKMLDRTTPIFVDRDKNAAKNILHLGFCVLAETSRPHPFRHV